MNNRNSLWLLGGLVFATSVAFAAEAPQSQAASVEINGVKVAIDPATGRLRPLTQQERRDLAKALGAQRRTAEPAGAGKKGFVLPRTQAESEAQQRKLPNGGVAQQVSSGEMSELVATQQADGSLRIGHADADGDSVPALQAQEK